MLDLPLQYTARGFFDRVCKDECFGVDMMDDATKVLYFKAGDHGKYDIGVMALLVGVF